MMEEEQFKELRRWEIEKWPLFFLSILLLLFFIYLLLCVCVCVVFRDGVATRFCATAPDDNKNLKQKIEAQTEGLKEHLRPI